MRNIGLRILLLIWLVSDLEFVCCVFTPVIRVNEGKLRGLRSVFGQHQYFSIPYATSKRFQSPENPAKWEGVLDAVNPFVRCPQKTVFFTSGSEDCLYLDVYTPEWATSLDKIPVMIFFHGGAYYKGSKDLYDPEFLVTKGAVVVIVNYRLGVLGFLCLNGVSNLGLKDQVLAMKWVKKNIRSFGGDPDNVTLCGQSAGASSAALHLLTDSSKGLFHKAILMSGTALSPWALNVEPFTAALEDARKISPAFTEKDVYDVFARAPLATLISATHDTSVDPRHFKYSPCVDVNSTQPFFKDTPYSILKSGKFNQVPIIVGYTDTEGGFFYRLLGVETVNDLNKNFNDRLPCVFSWCSKRETGIIGERIRSHYFGRGDIDYWTSVNGLIDFYSDWIAYGSINAFSKVMVQYSEEPVYCYQFSYEGNRNFGKVIAGVDFNGTTHAGELFYIFKPMGISLPLSERDKITIDRLTILIRNFMTYGNPTPKRSNLLPLKWPRANSNTSNILVLARGVSIIEHPKEKQRGDFFLKMLCAYGRDGYVPCDSEAACRPMKVLALSARCGGEFSDSRWSPTAPPPSPTTPDGAIRTISVVGTDFLIVPT